MKRLCRGDEVQSGVSESQFGRRRLEGLKRIYDAVGSTALPTASADSAAAISSSRPATTSW
jgi:hypothetical protein